MSNTYMVLIQKYIDVGLGPELVDNWYLKDTVYPGTLTFNDYNEALLQAERETYENGIGTIEKYKACVILCHETPKLKTYGN